MNADKLMADLFKPGATHLTTGLKGGGKTHWAVACAESLVKGKWPSAGKVVLFTNVIFIRKTANGQRREYPEGVTHITTMRDLFPAVAECIRENGRNVTILLLLDEAQNFLLGDLNFTHLTQAMKRFSGIIRKFNLCVWYLTPVERNLGPSFRNFIDDENDPGNVTCKWSKRQSLAEAYIRRNRMKIEPRQLISFQNGSTEPVRLMFVPCTEWTTPLEELKVGQYCYDHMANADFTIGDGFDFDRFVNVTSDISSFELLDTIDSFYAEDVSKEADAESAIYEEQANVCCRLRGMGLTWDQISKAVALPESTVRWRVKHYATIEVEKPPKTPATDPETGENPLRESEVASKIRNSNDDTLRSRHIYISTQTAGNGGVAETPLPPVQSEKGRQQPLSEPPISDGRYTLDELRRAAEYCLGGDEDDT